MARKPRPTNPTLQKDWRDAFIEALAAAGNVTLAAAAAGIHRTTAYDERAANPDFAKSWDVALDTAADLLEAEARRRAVQGLTEPVLYKGQVVKIRDEETGEETPLVLRKYSDTLLIFLLKGARPEKYRENKIVVVPQPEPAKQSPEDLLALWTDSDQLSTTASAA